MISERTIVIEELDAEGINLQETILNLEAQGYEEVWEEYLNHVLQAAIQTFISSFAMESALKIFPEANK